MISLDDMFKFDPESGSDYVTFDTRFRIVAYIRIWAHNMKRFYKLKRQVTKQIRVKDFVKKTTNIKVEIWLED